ncbi:MBL fold metallo-hydrolase [Breoghania sp. L-A4]|uniref:MBL fold metallo-hydrolase n=1 Tax=Breoghania sp. L-A4 TaxID=2304600 RepID=UPI000E3583F0|nr:MBL fold metallo-hydrolase [Breoghania sp. L-A4]AXS40115.1 MBL fold metallo-hydrolase [Breoghania sp. L-A4]
MHRPKSMLFGAVAAICYALLPPTGATADPVAGLTPVAVAPGIHALVGPLGQRDADNLGNNATFGVIETDAGAVVIDSGGSRRGAEALLKAIHTLTAKPVVAVINTGGQDHRWLGNGPFHDMGAAIYATEAAIADQKDRADMQFMVLENLIGAEGLAGTEAVYADTAVSEETTLTFGSTTVVLIPAGPAHTPGDMLVWLPQSRVVFAGDVVFLDRLLGILPVSSSSGWLEAFGRLEALDPNIVVPGHGSPAPLAKAQAQTRDYIASVRAAIGTLIEDNGLIQDAPTIDQSAYAALPGFDSLAGRNAQAVYQEMEWE